MTIKAITPKGINLKLHETALRDALLGGARRADNLFNQSYFTWEAENQPEFKTSTPKIVDGDLVVEHSTKDTPYVYVSNGTPGPYTITPKHAGGFLRFKAGGHPKTFPNKLVATMGMPGTDWHTAASVQHPGIEARNFPELVVEQLQPAVVGLIAQAISATTGG